MRDRLERLIEQVLEVSLPWVSTREGSVQFIDPLDKKEISAHYGASHMAASLIILGDLRNDSSLTRKGEDLLTSVLDRWDSSKALPEYHNDFNNFALCVLDSFTDRYHDRIQKTVLGTRDTTFDTINWLPMRWFVNRSRFVWTQDTIYTDVIRDCQAKIRQAAYSDGFIDDMLPKGRSFSLQYNVATVAFMQFLRVMGEDIDLSSETGALLNAVCPDGDINYMGRGTNQIFAWGPWIYLLSSSGQSELDRALRYLEDHLPQMLRNNNIMLNDLPGSQRYMWWDYHYCSVYTAHLLFWLILSLKDIGSKKIEPVLVDDGSSGINVYRNSDSFVVTFSGRSEYLAERGPSIAAIWTKRSGIICKGSFGPWYGLFGNRYVQPDVTLRNHLGLLSIKTDKDSSVMDNVLSKLRSNTHREEIESISPVFISPSVDISNGIKISYQINGSPLLLNIPLFDGEFSVAVDGDPKELEHTMRIRNQYGWITLGQTLIKYGKRIEIKVL